MVLLYGEVGGVGFFSLVYKNIAKIQEVDYSKIQEKTFEEETNGSL